MRHSLTLIAIALTLLSITPLDARAQREGAALVGTVRDQSGLVLPGVTVEATSPALIERTKAAVTDDRGQFRIVDLRPGTYTVTFNLDGFARTTHEDLTLVVGFTATVDASLKPAGVEETLVVSGQSPVVDLQNTARRSNLDRRFLDAVPSGRLYTNVVALIPGVVLGSTSGAPQDVGGTNGQANVSFQIHGGRVNDAQVQIDGMSIAGMFNNAGTTLMFPNEGAVEEYAISLAAHSAETETGGIRVNIVPREGTNQLRGGIFANVANGRLQSPNVTADLTRRGLRAPNRVKRMRDVNPTIGGPLVRDRLSFFASWRSTLTERYVGGLYYNRAPESVLYVPDVGRQAIEDQPGWDANGRLTWQASDRHKVTLYVNYNELCSCHNFISPTRAPEASWSNESKNRLVQAVWTSPLRSHLLLETGTSILFASQDRTPAEGFFGPPIVEASTGLNYRAPQIRPDSSYGNSQHRNLNFRGAVSYVSGMHQLKVGAHVAVTRLDERLRSIEDLSYRFLNGVPNAVVYYATPFNVIADLRPNLGVYAQDQWRAGRATVNAGLRFDMLRTIAPEQRLPAGTYVPERHFPAVDGLDWKDLSPRLGLSYDVSGRGRTVAKVTLGRFVVQEALDVTRLISPVSGSLNTATRTWRDDNGDFAPQAGELGPLSNANFGRTVITTRYDPAFTSGFGVRPFNWETSVGIDHTIAEGLAASVAYFRRSYGNFTVTDNLATNPADFDPFCITAPADSRLPGGGGQPICGLFDVRPERFGRVDNLVTHASRYGTQRENWNGVDVTAFARRERLTLQGGISTGRTMTDNCDVVVRVNNPSDRFCHVETPFLTQAKVAAGYRLPWELQLSAAFQSIPGSALSANYVATNAVISRSLGRNLSAGAAGTVTVNLLEPGTQYGPRLNQLDLRAAKTFQAGSRARVQAIVDVFNATNASTVLAQNTTYGTNGATWLVPLTILQGRLVKLGVNVSF